MLYLYLINAHSGELLWTIVLWFRDLRNIAKEKTHKALDMSYTYHNIHKKVVCKQYF